MRYLLHLGLFFCFVLGSPTQMFGRGDCSKLFNYKQSQVPTCRNHSLGARSGGYIMAQHTKGEPSPGHRANYGDAAFRK
jgi:hypothetical protein